MPLTYPCAILYNYQNAFFIHKSELKTHSTFINRAIKKYELIVRTTRTHKRISSLIIKFWNWVNIPLERVNYTPVPYVNYNETPSA